MSEVNVDAELVKSKNRVSLNEEKLVAIITRAIENLKYPD